jgi:hypothetical protein
VLYHSSSHRSEVRCSLLSKEFEHFFGHGKPPDLVLGKDQLSIGDDVKDAALALDQLGLDAELFTDQGRQTGGLREKLSGYAIGDRDTHSG